MSLQEAVEAPRVWTEGNALEVEQAVPDGVRTKLTSMGHEVVAVPTVAGGMKAIQFQFIGSAYSQNYNNQMQVALAAIARNGVRVELLDVSLLGNLIKANPGLYGLASGAACPLACIGNPALQNQFLFYVDQLHL